jgi:hypothetical protein
MKQLSLFDPIEIQLTRGYVAIVDPVDADLAAHKWCANNGKAPYAVRKIAKSQYAFMHRVVLSRKLGRELLPSELVDHIDGDISNNRRDNLRVATAAQNTRNRRLGSDNTSGFKGATFNKHGGRWTAQIKVDGRLIYLGSFDLPEAAACAYDEAARRYFGEFACCNFPQDGSR